MDVLGLYVIIGHVDKSFCVFVNICLKRKFSNNICFPVCAARFQSFPSTVMHGPAQIIICMEIMHWAQIDDASQSMHVFAIIRRKFQRCPSELPNRNPASDLSTCTTCTRCYNICMLKYVCECVCLYVDLFASTHSREIRLLANIYALFNAETRTIATLFTCFN